MMKSTGIVRKIDHLGRYVLPIEIQRNLNIGENDPVECFVDGDRIILQKYTPGCTLCGSVEIEKTLENKHFCNPCLKKLHA
jgi:transcriptional pleiotropic regulator of transition state genes